MNVLCFSSFTFAYLDRARVLFQSVKRHHKDWHCVALMTDAPPPGVDFDVANEAFDEIYWAKDLPVDNIDGWLFKHDIVEISTAVKGIYLDAVLPDWDAVVYMDPDTCMFSDLKGLLTQIEAGYDIALTPHQLVPESDNKAVRDNEITSLMTGIYNLGFVAVANRPEGRRFAAWWRDRLRHFCYDDIPLGLFVDQRWCDHVPAFFENVLIVRDPGFNVASWNLSHRVISIEHDGKIRVNGSLLKFWHFTKLGPVGETMTKRYAKENFEVYELWAWYQAEVKRAKDPSIPKGYWHYKSFEDGTPIKKIHRLLYRSREDLQAAFPSPYAVDENGGFVSWLRAEGLLEADDVAGFTPA